MKDDNNRGRSVPTSSVVKRTLRGHMTRAELGQFLWGTSRNDIQKMEQDGTIKPDVNEGKKGKFSIEYAQKLKERFATNRAIIEGKE